MHQVKRLVTIDREGRNPATTVSSVLDSNIWTPQQLFQCSYLYVRMAGSLAKVQPSHSGSRFWSNIYSSGSWWPLNAPLGSPARIELSLSVCCQTGSLQFLLKTASCFGLMRDWTETEKLQARKINLTSWKTRLCSINRRGLPRQVIPQISHGNLLFYCHETCKFPIGDDNGWPTCHISASFGKIWAAGKYWWTDWPPTENFNSWWATGWREYRREPPFHWPFTRGRVWW